VNTESEANPNKDNEEKQHEIQSFQHRPPRQRPAATMSKDEDEEENTRREVSNHKSGRRPSAGLPGLDSRLLARRQAHPPADGDRAESAASQRSRGAVVIVRRAGKLGENIIISGMELKVYSFCFLIIACVFPRNAV